MKEIKNSGAHGSDCVRTDHSPFVRVRVSVSLHRENLRSYKCCVTVRLIAFT